MSPRANRSKHGIQRVRWSVYAVALSLTALPALGAYYAMQGVVDSAVAIAVSPQMSQELAQSQKRLKELARYNRSESVGYRQEFERLQGLRESYAVLEDLGPALRRSYLQVFGLILGVTWLLAMALVAWLNRRIISAHAGALAEMRLAQERAFHLEAKESWRLFAQKLVHEIRNPLTPIQVMVGRLRKRHQVADPKAFRDDLQETASVVDEEIGKISLWVDAFTKYARMPEPKLEAATLRQVLERFAAYHDQAVQSKTHLEMNLDATSDLSLRLDPTLLRQVLFNLVKNSQEAAREGVRVTFETSWSSDGQFAILQVSDDGPGMPPEMLHRLFQPYSSLKREQGMGLGLAIAKKILLEHGGDLRYLALPKGCGFELIFPIPK